MSSRMTPKEEIIKIVNLMRAVRIRKDETHNAYYRRLDACGAEKSRATLQLVEKAMRETENDDEIYEKYCSMSRVRDHKRKKKNPDQLSFEDIEKQTAKHDPHEVISEKETFEVCGLVIEISIKTKGIKGKE